MLLQHMQQHPNHKNKTPRAAAPCGGMRGWPVHRPTHAPATPQNKRQHRPPIKLKPMSFPSSASQRRETIRAKQKNKSPSCSRSRVAACVAGRSTGQPHMPPQPPSEQTAQHPNHRHSGFFISRMCGRKISGLKPLVLRRQAVASHRSSRLRCRGSDCTGGWRGEPAPVRGKRGVSYPRCDDSFMTRSRVAIHVPRSICSTVFMTTGTRHTRDLYGLLVPSLWWLHAF